MLRKTVRNWFNNLITAKEYQLYLMHDLTPNFTWDYISVLSKKELSVSHLHSFYFSSAISGPSNTATGFSYASRKALGKIEMSEDFGNFNILYHIVKAVFGSWICRRTCQRKGKW